MVSGGEPGERRAWTRWTCGEAGVRRNGSDRLVRKARPSQPGGLVKDTVGFGHFVPTRGSHPASTGVHRRLRRCCVDPRFCSHRVKRYEQDGAIEAGPSGIRRAHLPSRQTTISTAPQHGSRVGVVWWEDNRGSWPVSAPMVVATENGSVQYAAWSSTSGRRIAAHSTICSSVDVCTMSSTYTDSVRRILKVVPLGGR